MGLATAFVSRLLRISQPQAVGTLGGLVPVLATIVLLFLFARPRVIRTTKRGGHETLWKRCGDKIVPSVISGVAVGTIMLLVGFAIGRGPAESDASAPVPSALTTLEAEPQDAGPRASAHSP